MASSLRNNAQQVETNWSWNAFLFYDSLTLIFEKKTQLKLLMLLNLSVTAPEIIKATNDNVPSVPYQGIYTSSVMCVITMLFIPKLHHRFNVYKEKGLAFVGFYQFLAVFQCSCMYKCKSQENVSVRYFLK